MIQYKMHLHEQSAIEQLANLVLDKKNRDEEFFEQLLKRIADALNPLLKSNPRSQDLPAWRVSKTQIESIRALIPSIIADLQKLAASTQLSAEQQGLQREIILNLDNFLKQIGPINPLQIMKLLALFPVSGVRMVSLNLQDLYGNARKLLDMEFPTELIPEEFTCEISSDIMDEPCISSKTSRIELRTAHSLENNPSTNLPWDERNTDSNLLNHINGFMKKVEWLYYAFNPARRYLDQYADPVVLADLRDAGLSYDDFRQKTLAGQQSSKKFVFFEQSASSNPLPTKALLNLCAKYQIFSLRPAAKDYEQLVRRIVVAAEPLDLKKLLSSKVFDVLKINVYARNKQNHSVLELVADYSKRFPKLSEQYQACLALLEAYQGKAPATENSPK